VAFYSGDRRAEEEDENKVGLGLLFTSFPFSVAETTPRYVALQ
tara:strand:+ start:610 stop:738 length:129 start_codon:yes stop_codon:yes gene_type:complete